MKPFACFSLAAMLLLLTSCERHDDMDFAGTVVNIEYCAIMDIQSNAGFYISLDYPENVGKEFSIAGESYENVVVMYEPNTRIVNGQHVHGTFYIDNTYNRSHCTRHIVEDEYLPQGVILKVSVDK